MQKMFVWMNQQVLCMWVPGLGGSTDYIPTDLGRIGRTPTPKLSLGLLLPHPTTNGESSFVILKSFPDDVVEAADGNIYLSDASSKFGLHNWYLDFLEAKPHGRLLKYDPSSRQISTLLDNLHFANGVALSADQNYVVVCESFKCRCIKYWVEGQKQGETEILIDHLPGAPDNINLAPDGSFWIALLHPIRDGWEFVARSKMARHILATFPNLCDLLVNGVRRRATVIKVGEDGRILRELDDPTGKVISFLTSAVEFQDHLYLGSLNANFLGKLSLTDT